MSVSPWNAALPSGWREVAVSRAFKIRLGKMLQTASANETDREVAYLKARHIQWNQVGIEELPKMWASISERQQYAVTSGDLLVCEGGDVGRAAIIRDVPKGTIIQNSVHRVRSTRNDVRFLGYALRLIHGSGWLEVVCNRATIAHLTVEKLGALRIGLPDSATQQAIADYLDGKTAAIDALIEKKRKLLNLLAEERAALINQAVTKGLDPDVPMKDSGIPWIGEVPAHWDLIQLRRVLMTIEQGWSPQCDSQPANSDEWGVLKAGCTAGGRFNSDQNKTLPGTFSPRPSLEVRKGDVVMSRASGSPKIVGSAALVGEVRPRLLLSDKLFRLRFAHSKVASAFIIGALASASGRAQIENAISGAEGLANNLPQSKVREIVVALPPLVEQETISDFLRKQLNISWTTEKHLTASYNRLQEYRQVLITAAVTGQFDIGQAA